MGIYAEPFVDVGELIDWKDDVVDRLTGGVEKLCEANGVTVREERRVLRPATPPRSTGSRPDGDPRFPRRCHADPELPASAGARDTDGVAARPCRAGLVAIP